MPDRRPGIAVLAPLYPPALEQLEREGVVHRMWEAADPDAALRALGHEASILVTTGLAGFTVAHLVALPAVRLVAVFGVGHDTLDVEAARARGVAVTNTPDSTHAAVAELAVGLVLAVARRMAEADRFVRAGRWPAGPFPLGTSLGGKRCGILGLGRIGRRIAERLEPFGLEVAYHARRPAPDAPYRFETDLVGLAARSDILIVACPLTESTRGLVDGGVLQALGPDGIVVNVARGPVIDRTALIAALRDGVIAGAGLDVYWDEPEVPPELMAMDRVVLLPHLGTSTRDIREERTRLLLANVRAHLTGAPLPTPVTS